MAGYVIDFFVDRIRVQALHTYVKAYQPEIAVDELKSRLCFQKRKECFRWLREQGCMVSEDKRMVDTKESLKSLGEKRAANAPAARQQQEPAVKRAPMSIDELLAAGKQKSNDAKAQKANKKVHKQIKKKGKGKGFH